MLTSFVDCFLGHRHSSLAHCHSLPADVASTPTASLSLLQALAARVDSYHETRMNGATIGIPLRADIIKKLAKAQVGGCGCVCVWVWVGGRVGVGVCVCVCTNARVKR
jgi:hypothetical protein